MALVTSSPPVVVRFLHPNVAGDLPNHYRQGLPEDTVYVQDEDHDEILNIVNSSQPLEDGVGKVAFRLKGSSNFYSTDWRKELLWTLDGVFLWSRVPMFSYAELPWGESGNALFIHIPCTMTDCALALAYALWRIYDTSTTIYNCSPTLLALSYVFLPEGVYAFCIYDGGLEWYRFCMEQQVRLPRGTPFWQPLCTTLRPWEDFCPTDRMIQNCILAASFLHVLQPDHDTVTEVAGDGHAIASLTV